MLALEKVTRHTLCHPDRSHDRYEFVVGPDAVTITRYVARRVASRRIEAIPFARQQYRALRDEAGYWPW